ncbi:hypothetical protein DC915_RS02015 [Vibrio parahaemolyticus]|uniref:Bypass of forespore C C-terminal domain-containing protein n=2 Tax=Vibrio harveyi group TaxID=717610 RepID=A0A9Q3UA69_VIBPH|nr:hypothetical protein [Vibrio parahaemolyticus]ELA8176584.1 hypothetical protein [Vibrio alginolyticus]CAH1598397.1 exported hypothetical protein [Vibrio jasicida]EJC7176017.1 hypothetical protein [Vibrio parahaemolyticus]EJE4724455.1 hypothetical protein [Vibrio parahaemolyticus]EJG0009750.1 hypothetical protein [Vibrio parahaemolyticus]
MNRKIILCSFALLSTGILSFWAGRQSTVVTFDVKNYEDIELKPDVPNQSAINEMCRTMYLTSKASTDNQIYRVISTDGVWDAVGSSGLCSVLSKRFDRSNNSIVSHPASLEYFEVKRELNLHLVSEEEFKKLLASMHK